jgi:hypothetical protein
MFLKMLVIYVTRWNCQSSFRVIDIFDFTRWSFLVVDDTLHITPLPPRNLHGLPLGLMGRIIVYSA